jgi:antitoxin PrlF
MPTATITSKGQTTIPREIREHLNLKPGDRVSFNIEDGRVVLRPKNRSVMQLAGMLKRPGQPSMTAEDMTEAAMATVLERDARSRQ